MAKIKWYLVAAGLLFGMIIAGWGWDKYESTIEARTHGSVAMIIVGAVMFVVSVATLAAGWGRKGS